MNCQFFLMAVRTIVLLYHIFRPSILFYFILGFHPITILCWVKYISLSTVSGFSFYLVFEFNKPLHLVSKI